MPRSSARRSSTPASRTTRRSNCRHAGAETPKAAFSGGLRTSGAEGARTPDLRAASATLSQLSYSPRPVLGGHCNAHLLVVPGPSGRRERDAVERDARAPHLVVVGAQQDSAVAGDRQLADAGRDRVVLRRGVVRNDATADDG